ncbi:MAG: hypothetical protein HBSAPP03_05120 [Phycisphaerae bacterium]|nr:MAG: hypothetical protein HBSAPP03_05120 [Phycisphaerae bacterium]
MFIRPCILALGLAASGAFGQVLMNPSFETGAPIMTTGAAPVGAWGWDSCAFVGPSMGIFPAHGNRMLRFLATTPGGPSADTVSRVAQVVDFTPMTSSINAGLVTVTAGMMFNRRQTGPPFQADTLFRMHVAAYSTPTVIQPTNFPSGALALSTGTLISDANPATWQPISVSLLLPAGTTHVLVAIEAVENVFNNFTGSEFSGHFADNGRMIYTPAPGTLLLAGAPLLLMARRRR